MRKLVIRLFIPLIAFLLGVAATMLFIEVWPKQELRILNPNRRQDIYFYTIDKRASQAGLPSLRTTLLPRNDFEIRVWVISGLNGEDGLVLRKTNGQWSALHLHGIAQEPPFPNSKTNLASPKSGWENAWQKLVNAGILSLPDADELHCNPGVLDGVGYAVEINKNRTYRIYGYSNPRFAECKEAKQMITIGKIIADEYGVEWFGTAE
ncbi:MAG: hypothetical protein M3X11_16655 [Acidobacteriota bacterium]|nr:hypothetical protein [Acidobacteriota bacterium]